MDGNFGLKRTTRGENAVITATEAVSEKYFLAEKHVPKYVGKDIPAQVPLCRFERSG